MSKSYMLAAFVLSALALSAAARAAVPTAAQTQTPAPTAARTPAPTPARTPQTPVQAQSPAPAQPPSGQAQQPNPAQAQTPSPAPSATPTVAPSKLVRTPDGHEYAPFEERAINYKDWTFKSLKDGTPLNLREWARGKKLVMVVYYAPWCGNWRNEAPIVAKLYDKYKAQGFDVVAVNEYGSQDDARQFFGEAGAPYAVVVESEERAAREQTTHYNYRQACGDPRRWGSPFNIFLEPSKLNQTGDVLTEKAWVVGGELTEEEAERFIRQRLGLKEKADAKESAIPQEKANAEPCRDEPKSGKIELSGNAKKSPR